MTAKLINQLRGELQVALEENTRLANELANARAPYDQLINDLTGQVAGLTVENANLSSQLVSRQDDIASLIQDKKQLEANVIAVTAQRDSAERNLDAAIYNLNALREKVVAIYDATPDELLALNLPPEWSQRREPFTEPPTPERRDPPGTT